MEDEETRHGTAEAQVQGVNEPRGLAQVGGWHKQHVKSRSPIPQTTPSLCPGAQQTTQPLALSAFVYAV